MVQGFGFNSRDARFNACPNGFYGGYIGIMEKKMETTIYGLGLRVEGYPFAPPKQEVKFQTWKRSSRSLLLTLMYGLVKSHGVPLVSPCIAAG